LDEKKTKNYVYYDDVLKKLQYGIDNNLTRIETTNYYNVHDDYFYDYLRYGGRRALQCDTITQEEYQKISDLYDKLKRNKHKELTISNPDDFCEDSAEFVRDENGKIIYYTYQIKNKYGELVKGNISTTTMDKILSLYTNEGLKLTQRQVFRELLDELDLDFHTFQKILKAFSITKASIPFGFHELEEKGVEEKVADTFRTKEKLFFKRIEAERYKHIESNYLKLLQEHTNLKNRFKNVSEWIKTISLEDVDPYKFKIINNTTDKALIVVLSDLHMGAMVTEDSLYDNNYDVKEVYRRFEVILNHIINLSKDIGVFDRIILVNLGDALDGFDNSTIRHHGHQLPQNLTNKQQFESYVKLMKDFVEELYEHEIAENIDFYSVNEGNHDGINGFIANRLLEEFFKIKYPGMIALTFDRFIDFINYGEHTILFSHGKDGKDMTRGYPLFLDDKTENKINEFLDNYFDVSLYNKNVVFVKGDLHQSANSYGKRFQYKSVGSLFGSSTWSQLNFGLAKPVCEYMILGKDNKNDMLEGKIYLK
jgi:hypothetical protein